MATKEKKTVDQEDEEKDLETDIEEEDADLDTDEDEEIDDTSEEDEDDESEETDEPTIEEQLAKQKSKANKYRRLFQNARKHSQKSKADKPERKQPAAPAVDVDERVLRAQGMEPELLKELKAIARVREVSLIDAQSDPLFVAAKDLYEKEKAKKAASLPASRGSGSKKPAKDLKTPGLSRDEHRSLAKERLST